MALGGARKRGEIQLLVLVQATLIRSRSDFTSFGLILGSRDWSAATNEAVITRPRRQTRNNYARQSLGRRSAAETCDFDHSAVSQKRSITATGLLLAADEVK